MTDRTDHVEAIAYLNRLKFEALADKRACAKTSNPLAPVPGMEKEFEEADHTIKRVDFILKEIGAPAPARRKRAFTGFTLGALDRLLHILLGIGIFGVAAIGVATICLVLGVRPLALLVGAAVVAVIAEAWGRRRSDRPRK